MQSPSLFVPFRDSAYRRVWVGQILNVIGDGVFQVALIFDVLHARGAGHRSELGFVLAADSAGLLAALLLGGLLADRLGCRPLMICADLLQAAAVVSFALVGPGAPLVVLAALAFVVGVGIGLFYPAYQALLPSLLAPEVRQAGNALMSVLTGVAGVLGPGLGGLVVTIAGSSRVAFLLDGASFLISVGTLFGVHELERRGGNEPAASGVIADALAGLHAVWQWRWMAVVIAQGTLQVLLVVAPEVVLLPLVLRARGELGVYGFLLAAQAAGSIAGGILAARLSPRQPGIVAMAALLALTPELSFLAFHVPLGLLGVSVVLTGSGYAVFGVLWSTAMQRAVPEQLWSRVFAIESIGTYALDPVGTAATAPAVAAFGLPVVAGFAAVMLVVTTVLPIGVPGVRELSDRADAGQSSPS